MTPTIMRLVLSIEKNMHNFFTPPEIAHFMSKWVCGNNPKQILDPAFGLGIFSEEIKKIDNSINVIGFDIDPTIIKFYKSRHPESAVDLINKDYLFNNWENTYESIICNPPYFRFQEFFQKDDAIIEFQQKLNIELSGYTNVYSMFLLKSAHQLKKNGRSAYIIPSEFLNSDYGKIIKEHLLQTNTLKYVILFDSNSKIFADATTTSCIILLSNDTLKKDVSFINISSLDDLKEIADGLELYPKCDPRSIKVKHSDLLANVKWRSYYSKTYADDFSDKLANFSNFGKVSRGIATGDNKYFTFNEEKISEFNIPYDYLHRCICKSAHVSGHFLTDLHFERIRESNKDCFVF